MSYFMPSLFQFVQSCTKIEHIAFCEDTLECFEFRVLALLNSEEEILGDLPAAVSELLLVRGRSFGVLVIGEQTDDQARKLLSETNMIKCYTGDIRGQLLQLLTANLSNLLEESHCRVQEILNYHIHIVMVVEARQSRNFDSI